MLKKVSDTDALPRDADAMARKPAPSRKKLVLPLLALLFVGAGAAFGVYWWTEGRFLIETDDAYIAADMAVLTARVNGYVTSLPVAENQPVKAGQPVVEIDPGDLQLDLDAAEARIATQEAAIDRIDAQRRAGAAAVVQAEAQLEALQAAETEAKRNFDRAADLARTGAGAQAALDTARNALAEASASVRGGSAAIDSAKANVSVLDAQIAEARRNLAELGVARDSAARNLTFATVRAPYDGVIGNLSVQPGDLVSPSRRLATIVPLDRVYIDANFKETQIGGIAPGATASIEVDALPGVDLKGTVESFAPASGSVFSLLPADNATGNFTKIVQRVPVRIRIDDPQAADGKLRPGLSAVVTVDRRTATTGDVE